MSDQPEGTFNTAPADDMYWIGQRVIWLHTPRAGYGYTVKVLCKVAKSPKPSSKSIRIQLNDGTFRTVRRDRVRLDL